jgi:hypothetical protein
LRIFASRNGEQQENTFGRDWVEKRKEQNSGHKNLKEGDILRDPGTDGR